MSDFDGTFGEATFGDGGGEPRPWARDLIGRFCVIEPIRLDPNNTYQDDLQKAAFANVLVLDASGISGEFAGGPLEYGGTQTRGNTDRIACPAYFENMKFTGVNQYSTIEDWLNAIQNDPTGRAPKVHVAKLFKSEVGNKGNKPVNIGKIKVNEHGQARDPQIIEALYNMAGRAWTALKDGSWIPPESELIPVPTWASPEAQKYYASRIEYRRQRSGGAMPAPAPAQNAPAPTTSPNPYAQQPPAAPAPQAPAQDAPARPNGTAPNGWPQDIWDTLPAAIAADTLAKMSAPVQPTH